jgi:lipopolysaccharide/colanic/teichoic acid biosynthesis glycosyltransferase
MTDILESSMPASVTAVQAPIVSKRFYRKFWVVLHHRIYQVEHLEQQWIVKRATQLSNLEVIHTYDLAELQRMSPHLIALDSRLSASDLTLWIEACQARAQKVVMSVPLHDRLPCDRVPKTWQVKRFLDCLAAAVLLTTLSPFLLGLAIVVALDSPGPILFKQWRVGQSGTFFQIYKFRSMQVDAERRHQELLGNQQGLHKLENDPRMTRCGRWLRKYSLDELPQLINVLNGEMSLVGPRPWALYDARRIPLEVRSRLNATPGITGAWQVEERSNELDLQRVSDRDLEYLENWSLWQDFKILLKTIPKVLSGFGAC